MLRLKVDQNADAAYVRVGDQPVAKTREKNEQVILDYDKDGKVVGIEFLAISEGIDLKNLPHQDELIKLFAGRGYKVYA